MSHPKLPEQITPFQLTVLVLSIFVLISLTIEVIFSLPEEMVKILIYADTGICVVFFIDFVQQWRAAPSKLQYMKLGWIDLISCIPLMEINQYGRLIRVFRLLRAIKSIAMVSRTINENKAVSTLHFMVVIGSMTLTFSSMYILYLERGVAGANIQTAADAFWWTFVTITTVGYGDFFPVTFEGRVVAIILMTTGVGMFGSCTAILASWIMDSTKERKMEAEILNDVNELKSEISELKQLLKQVKKQED
ncbi:potassium channel family protein [Vibrio sp. JC009]|uniref:potassium channel family protein n=1 Tax=Vibrio sp. JC009 TaxID=2912314 RepID=UPI0023B15DF2|nr:potassium channel family protein [Vibrio sp. JC009]WED23999.1 potassium channel family protein [Vibrio sp. JC009]